MILKSTLRLLVVSLSGVSTFFAFPFLYIFVARLFFHVVRASDLLEFDLIASVIVCALVYDTIRNIDTKKIQISKTTLRITLIAGCLTFIVFAGLVGSELSQITNISNFLLILNFFFFSTIVLSSLHYFVKTKSNAFLQILRRFTSARSSKSFQRGTQIYATSNRKHMNCPK